MQHAACTKDVQLSLTKTCCFSELPWEDNIKARQLVAFTRWFMRLAAAAGVPCEVAFWIDYCCCEQEGSEGFILEQLEARWPLRPASNPCFLGKKKRFAKVRPVGHSLQEDRFGMDLAMAALPLYIACCSKVVVWRTVDFDRRCWTMVERLLSYSFWTSDVIFLGLTPPAGCAVWDQIWEREDLIAFASSYHDSMLGLCWCWSYVGSKLGHVGSMSGLRGALLGPRRLMFDQNRGSVGPCWGYVGAITRWAGLCRAILRLCWGYVGPSWGYVGAMLAHLESMLEPCSPILGLCWGYVDPPEVILGLRWVHEFTFIPKICLKKLSPVACEAPTLFVQHHFSEKAESCLGRAHPRRAPEGSHQWPARFQERVGGGSAVGRRFRLVPP